MLDAVAAPTTPDLDELLGGGLLVADGPLLGFRHELSRLAVERQVPAHRGKDTHRRALAAMQAHGDGDEARLAYHADGAEDAAAVLRFAQAAAVRASALGPHREAAARRTLLTGVTPAPPRGCGAARDDAEHKPVTGCL